MLNAFLTLGHASAETILDFAKRWGVMRFCSHGMPASHPVLRFCDHEMSERDRFLRQLVASPCPQFEWTSQDPWESHYIPGNPGLWPHAEPLALWRSFATEARAILTVSKDIEHGRLSKEPVIRVAGHRILAPSLPSERYQLPSECYPICTTPDKTREKLDEFLLNENRDTLRKVLNEWLSMANIGPVIQHEQKEFSMSLTASHLFGALTLQLVSAVCQGKEVYLCDDCAMPYIPPKRRPRLKEQHFCPDCSGNRKVAQRNASRRYRESQRQAKRRP